MHHCAQMIKAVAKIIEQESANWGDFKVLEEGDIVGLLPGKNDFWGGKINTIFVFFLREVTFSLFVRDYWGGLSQRERDEIGVGSSLQRKSRGVGLTIIDYY